MNFNEHYSLKDKHAFLSPSKYHWMNYSDEKLAATYLKHMATQKGTELHAFANDAIRLGIKLPKTRQTLNLYVNDAIGFRMKTEQTLAYSNNFFGTADAIAFSEKKSLLRIHDLKTGTTPASMKQLEGYTALFFLEYDQYRIEDTEVELRIYQNDNVIIHNPSVESINRIMVTAVHFDKQIEMMKEELLIENPNNSDLLEVFSKLLKL